MKAYVEPREVYGEWKFYPKNDTAELLAKIAGTKTLTTQTIRHATEMGIEFLWMQHGAVGPLVAAMYK